MNTQVEVTNGTSKMRKIAKKRFTQNTLNFDSSSIQQDPEVSENSDQEHHETDHKTAQNEKWQSNHSDMEHGEHISNPSNVVYIKGVEDNIVPKILAKPLAFNREFDSKYGKATDIHFSIKVSASE